MVANLQKMEKVPVVSHSEKLHIPSDRNWGEYQNHSLTYLFYLVLL